MGSGELASLHNWLCSAETTGSVGELACMYVVVSGLVGCRVLDPRLQFDGRWEDMRPQRCQRVVLHHANMILCLNFSNTLVEVFVHLDVPKVDLPQSDPS